jgi:mono/diheme cytochrome c family protein
MRTSILAAIAALLAAPALAQTSAGNVEAGRDLALQLCSGCHFVAAGQRPPVAVQAPPFLMLANDPAVTEFRLRNFLRTPHPVMPTLILSAQETDDVIAYILGLKHTKAR